MSIDNAAFASAIAHYLRTVNPFSFTEKGKYFQQGICPSCGKKSLFTSIEKPFVLKCNHDNACGYSEHVKDAIPELYDEIIKQFPATQEDRDASASVYLALNRGFDLSKIQGWYEQTYVPQKNGEKLIAVRFYLDNEKTRYWERIISRTDGAKANFGGKRKEDKSLYLGDVWMPPGMELAKGDNCFIVEGIFDAIALYHASYKAVACFSCQHYPTTFIEQYKKKNIQFVIALDSDKAGLEWAKKQHKKLKESGALGVVCIPPHGKDWNDLWLAGKLDDNTTKDGKYYGNLHLAKTVEEKAYHYYVRHQQTSFILEFGNEVFSISVDHSGICKALVILYESERLKDVQQKHNEKNKQKKIKGKGTQEGEAEEVAPEKQEEVPNYWLEAQLLPEGKEAFYQNVSVAEIINVYPKFQYIERNELLGEQYYVFSIDYPHGKSQDIIQFDGGDIANTSSFQQALLKKTFGGSFEGTPGDLRRLRNMWFRGTPLEVKAVPYIGYIPDIKAYVYNRHAWENGRRLWVNNHEFVTIKKQGYKTSLKGVVINTDGEFTPNWLDDFCLVFSNQGLVALSFFFGSLFAHQIRARYKSFPFFELTGEPGSGKTTLLEFLWKCLGRDEYEGFDLLKSTIAGRRRAFSQVSNMPIVLIESDRENTENDAKQRATSFEELKPFYNGRGTGTLGIAKRGNDTDESYFQGTIVISQNAEVDGSEALLQRIVHCHANKAHHSPITFKKARWFEAQTSDTVGGFLQTALSKEKAILGQIDKAYEHFFKLYEEGIKDRRLVQGHALIAACGAALQNVFPEQMTTERVAQLGDFLLERGKVRETRLGADHPIIEQFWDTYEYITSRSKVDECLNHSKRPEELIALSFEDYRAYCVKFNLEIPNLAFVRKNIENSKRYPLQAKRRTVDSRLVNDKQSCWVFRKKRAKE